MKRRRVLLTLIAMTALVFMIITISYGYWTDQLIISGEANFEFELPIVNDSPMPTEDQIEDFETHEQENIESPETATDDNPQENSINPQKHHAPENDLRSTNSTTDRAVDTAIDEPPRADGPATVPVTNDEDKPELEPEEGEKSVEDESTEYQEVQTDQQSIAVPLYRTCPVAISH